MRDRVEYLAKIENQKPVIMINGISFDEINNILTSIILCEEDFADVEKVPLLETVEIPLSSTSSHNPVISEALKELKVGNIKNILDLLIFLSRYILRERGRSEFHLLGITTMRKMNIAFEINLLQYFISNNNALFKDVRFTDAGKSFINNAKIQKILKNLND